MKKHLLVFVLFAFSLYSCGIFKKTASMKENTSSSAWNEFLGQFSAARFNAEYLSQKGTADIRMPHFSVSVTFHADMIKDTALLLRVSKFGFPLGKALVTPEKAAYYENWNNTCYEGNPEEMAGKFGLNFDFSQLQALLTGDALFLPDPQNWKLELRDDPDAPYLLIPLIDLPVKEMALTPFFKIRYEILEHQGKQARIFYEEYKGVGNTFLPQNIRMETSSGQIELHMKKSRIDERPQIRFRLPSGCKKAEL